MVNSNARRAIGANLGAPLWTRSLTASAALSERGYNANAG